MKKVQNWATSVFSDGYTLLKSIGYYQGSSEEAIILNVLFDHDFDLRDHLERLKQALKQDVILVAKSTVDLEVV